MTKLTFDAYLRYDELSSISLIILGLQGPFPGLR